MNILFSTQRLERTASELRKAVARRRSACGQAFVLRVKTGHAQFGSEPIEIATKRQESLGIATKRLIPPHLEPCGTRADEGESSLLAFLVRSW
jgi:hypothetical protein